MFSDFTYNNIGLPKNKILPWYAEDFPDQWGFTGNPLGIASSTWEWVFSWMATMDRRSLQI